MHQNQYQKHYKDNGIIPIIDQSQSYVAGYTDDESATPPVLPCIVFGDQYKGCEIRRQDLCSRG